MGNKKKWDILVLSGDSNDIEILSSYISEESLGSSNYNSDMQLYYFDIGKRDLIENILINHIDNFKVDFSWDITEDQDWHLNWKDNFTPIKINQDLLIIPDWDNNLYNCNNIIKIKPGMAFGTGHHETTFLMLKHLITNINKRDSVLDLGAGSGILSIAAYIYGANNITAVEFDDDCKDNFQENMYINNINESNIEFLNQDVLLFSNFDYDIILANINKNIIKDLIPKLKRTKAKILLSGILETDQVEIESLLKLHDINLMYKDQYNEWILMVVKND